MMKIGLIGTGNIGKPMAMNLLKAGYKLTIYARHKYKIQDLATLGANLVDSPRAVAQASDIIITCLPMPSDLEEVALGENGILSGVRDGQTIICCGTMSPSTLVKISKAAKEKNVFMIDAPVSGGVEGAKSGTLTIMVGGDKKIIERCREVLQILGKRIYHTGDIGSGNIVKLVNQMINMTNLIGTVEGLMLGAKAGISPKKLYDILSVSSANSYVIERKVPRYILKGKFEPGFKIDLACKDLRLATRLGEELSVPIVFGNIALQIFEYAKISGLYDKDESAIITLLEKPLKIKFRDNEKV